jgi:hypothetical protein
MSQYGQAQPFSFFGYPQGYTGGFTPYQRIFDPKAAATAAALATAQDNPVAMQDTTQRWNGEGNPPEGEGWQRTNIGQGQFEWTRTVRAPVPITGAGGSMGGTEREGPSAFSQLTPAERAAYYAENPTEGKIALGMQDYVSTNPLGFISKVINPDNWYDNRLEKMGVDPTISLNTQNLLAGEAMQKALDSQTKSQVVTAPIVETPVPVVTTPIVEAPVPVVTAPIVETPAITEGLLSTPPVASVNEAAQAQAQAEIQSLLSRYPAPVAPPAPTETAPIAAPAPAAETAQQKLDRENFESAQAWQRERDAYLKTLAPTREEAEAIARANAELAAAWQREQDRANYESAVAWQREQDRANYESAVAWQKAQTESDLETQNLLNRYPAPTGGGGAVSGGGGMLGNQSAATRAALRSNEGYGGLYKGGHVSMQHLQGPNPMGPDDGYAALKDGEFVINDKAVKKYGIELMNAINSGKISKGKLLGLLEM